MLRNLILTCTVAIFALPASESLAQVGFYPTYRDDAYRELSQTGKYHGYWRDRGYGVNPQQYGVYVYPGYGVPYPVYGYGGYGYGNYIAPYGEIRTSPDYYHPPRSYPYRHRF